MLEWADGDGDEGDVDRCNEWDDLDAERVRWGAAVAAGLRRALLPARSEQPGDSNGDDLVCRFLPRPRDAPGVVTAMTISCLDYTPSRVSKGGLINAKRPKGGDPKRCET